MKRIAKPVTLLAIGAVVFYGGWQLSKSRSFQLFGELFPRVETAERVVALTFDDGPTARPLQTLLPVLRERGVRAAFSVIGSQLAQHPELGRTRGR